MATTYTYSYATNFGSNLDQTQFHNEVAADGGIAPTLLRVDMNGDDVDVVFDSALSAGEQTTLGNLVAAHTPAAATGSNLFTININSSPISSTNYLPVATFEFPGSSIMTTITNIKTISHKTTGGTSYDIRVYDSTNFTEICSANLTNTAEASNDLGTISNIPATTAIFEVQVKVTGSTSVITKSLNICYN